MRFWGRALALAGLLAVSGPVVAQDAAPPLSADKVDQLRKDAARILFWSDDERARNFQSMETIFPGAEVGPSATPRALPDGDPLPMDAAKIRNFMDQYNMAGLIVVQDGKVRFEHYALGFAADKRWTSFSVAKSFTSTLVGAAVKDGKIASLDDNVVKYVPELAGSAYDGVTVRQVLTMTSGVKWNEDYTDPNSDVVKSGIATAPAGQNPLIAYLAKLPREAAPGTKWVYKTGETSLIGIIVERAVGMRLADYAAQKIVGPAGFEGKLFWMFDTTGGNIGGCCLSVRLRDYARMGLFALEGGHGVVPDGWFTDAGKAQVKFDFAPGFGYGYQWWTYPGGAYGAQGIFGQSITLWPDKHLVIAAVSNWEKASDRDLSAKRFAFFSEIAQAATAAPAPAPAPDAGSAQ